MDFIEEYSRTWVMREEIELDTLSEYVISIRALSFCTFSFGHCVFCSSSIYGFWLPLWYLQTFLNIPSNSQIEILIECDLNQYLRIKKAKGVAVPVNKAYNNIVFILTIYFYEWLIE